MANKRSIKKAIHYICENLFAEAIALSLYGAKEQKEAANALFVPIIKLEEEYICRVSHPEPGMKPFTYFKDLREKFAARVNEIFDQMNG